MNFTYHDISAMVWTESGLVESSQNDPTFQLGEFLKQKISIDYSLIFSQNVHYGGLYSIFRYDPLCRSTQDYPSEGCVLPDILLANSTGEQLLVCRRENVLICVDVVGYNLMFVYICQLTSICWFKSPFHFSLCLISVVLTPIFSGFPGCKNPAPFSKQRGFWCLHGSAASRPPWCLREDQPCPQWLKLMKMVTLR